MTSAGCRNSDRDNNKKPVNFRRVCETEGQHTYHHFPNDNRMVSVCNRCGDVLISTLPPVITPVPHITTVTGECPCCLSAVELKVDIPYPGTPPDKV